MRPTEPAAPDQLDLDDAPSVTSTQGAVPLGVDLRDAELTEAELAEMALAAPPVDVWSEDAVPFGDPDTTSGLLPSWYMPAPVGRGPGGRHRTVAAIVIVAFLVINALGLCITYGVLEIA